MPLWRGGDWEELGGSGAGQVLLFDLGTGYTGVFTTQEFVFLDNFMTCTLQTEKAFKIVLTIISTRHSHQPWCVPCEPRSVSFLILRAVPAADLPLQPPSPAALGWRCTEGVRGAWAHGSHRSPTPGLRLSTPAHLARRSPAAGSAPSGGWQPLPCSPAGPGELPPAAAPD